MSSLFPELRGAGPESRHFLAGAKGKLPKLPNAVARPFSSSYWPQTPGTWSCSTLCLCMDHPGASHNHSSWGWALITAGKQPLSLVGCIVSTSTVSQIATKTFFPLPAPSWNVVFHKIKYHLLICLNPSIMGNITAT